MNLNKPLKLQFLVGVEPEGQDIFADTALLPKDLVEQVVKELIRALQNHELNMLHIDVEEERAPDPRYSGQVKMHFIKPKSFQKARPRQACFVCTEARQFCF